MGIEAPKGQPPVSMAEEAKANFQAFANNEYPGRGIVLGDAADGLPVQIYFLMGRSAGSRNRILVEEPGKSGRVRTAVADPDKESGDLALTIYTAMREQYDNFFVSNGKQTDDLAEDECLLGMDDYKYEEDAQGCVTPRIGGITNFYAGDSSSEVCLGILRKSQYSKECLYTYHYLGQVEAGYGYLIHTYEGNGNPLPAFEGAPRIVPIEGTNLEEIAQTYWTALNEANRVALAAKKIRGDGSSELVIINQYEKA